MHIGMCYPGKCRPQAEGVCGYCFFLLLLLIFTNNTEFISLLGATVILSHSCLSIYGLVSQKLPFQYIQSVTHR